MFLDPFCFDGEQKLQEYAIKTAVGQRFILWRDDKKGGSCEPGDNVLGSDQESLGDF